jgi:ABC-type oligopeptide transport system ATPase subunit
MEPPSDALLVVRRLKKYFPIHKGLFNRHVGDVKAVDGVSFFLRRGETLGMVGESGCGKSTTGRTLLLIALHQMVHYGQIADARRAAGRKPLM